MGLQTVGHGWAMFTSLLQGIFPTQGWNPGLFCLLISPPDRSRSDYCFCFGPAASFFLELLPIALHSFPIAYWTLFTLGCSSSDVITFCLFILSMGFLQQEYWFAFPPPADHILSELFTMTHPSWVALHGMAHSFIGLCKSLCHGQGCDPWTGER